MQNNTKQITQTSCTATAMWAQAPSIYTLITITDCISKERVSRFQGAGIRGEVNGFIGAKKSTFF